MSKRKISYLSAALLLTIFTTIIWSLSKTIDNLPNRVSQNEMIIIGQNRLIPGSQAALRVVVRDNKDGSPQANNIIKVSLKPNSGGPALLVYSGVTDQGGVADVRFNVPENIEPDQSLIVETQSKNGSDTITRLITVERDYRILLTSDKPIYQPGQIIHLRILALSSFDLTPAVGQDLEITIADGKGNKVFRDKLVTSKFGVTSADFQLANEVNTGSFKITASMGEISSEKTVTVEHYVLPKFDIDLNTERGYYLPGEIVVGALKANYFFGKPVANGDVILQGYTFDVEQTQVFEMVGKTDGDGNFNFEFELPDYIAGSDLEAGIGRFYLQATVTDQTQHSEISNTSIPISGSAILIQAIPEGGQFRRDLDNIMYVLTSYPDGEPAETTLSVSFVNNGSIRQVETGPFGLAEVSLTPQEYWQQFVIEARDKLGNVAQREFYFEGEYSEESILLRPDRPVYRVGESMVLTILTSRPKGTVYLDIVREGQTISTRSVVIQDSSAEVVIDLTPDLFGTLEVHAYKILQSGAITRDTRLIVVDNANDLNLKLGMLLPPGTETYKPGDTANADIQVTGHNGSGVQSAIGIAIVDESVFALAEQDPGFAKLYFMLEHELLQPKYDLHGYSLPDLVSGVPVSSSADFVSAIEDSAQASLAEVTQRSFGANISPFSLQANSHQDAVQRTIDVRENYFTSLSKALYAVFLLTPFIILGICAFALWRQKLLWRSLLTLILMGLFLIIIVLLALLSDNQSLLRFLSPLNIFTQFLDWITWETEVLIPGLVLLGLCAYLVLVIVAWKRKDHALGLSLALLVFGFITLVLLFAAIARSSLNINDSMILFSLVSFALLPLAFLLRFAAFSWQKRVAPAIAAFLLSAFLLMGALPALALGERSMSSGVQRNLRFVDQDIMVEEGEIMPLMVLAPLEAPAADREAGTSRKALTPEVDSTSSAEPPRLRQYFPETMLWLPDLVSDESGSVQLEFPVADNITTWRIAALASSQDGRLGSTEVGLRVFQDFFIDLDLPVALTVGDEISIPIGIFNYLGESQSVRLELEQMSWFELLDDPVKELEIGANDISVVYFRVHAIQFGRHPFKVTAWGSKMSDAIQKEVQIYPDGKQIMFSQSDRLLADTPVQQNVFIPTEAIHGTQTLVVKIYPGILSQVVEGLDSILRMPFGCFEQTSSTTYPNVLVLDYLRTTNQVSPETEFKAEEFINLGYQRLLTFEVGGTGGFSLFGDSPADRMLTAYGLQEFSDMSRVHDVDPALLKRTADWLLSQQSSDGSWENDRGLVHENTWSSLGNDRLPVTAFIAWSLVDAGFSNEPGTEQAIAYIQDHLDQAEDAYVVALVANAMVAADLNANGVISPATGRVLERLASMAIREGNGAYWQSGVATFMGSQGKTGSIETTALATLAFLHAKSLPELGNAGLTYLVQQKDSFGTWYSTQATVLALKALIQSVRSGAENVHASITVSLNGSQNRIVQVNQENFDVVQLLSFDDLNSGDNLVEISMVGEGNLMYQVSSNYYLPWNALPKYPEIDRMEDLVSIELKYDRSQIAVNDLVDVQVIISLNKPGARAESSLIDLGLPPGFSVQSEDLAALVAKYNDVPPDYALPKIERFELTGRQILVYVSNLSYGNPLEFHYHLKAKFPLAAQTPASYAYDYYNPDVSGEAQPLTLVVIP